MTDFLFIDCQLRSLFFLFPFKMLPHCHLINPVSITVALNLQFYMINYTVLRQCNLGRKIKYENELFE